MSSKRYPEEFLIEAVKQVTERGYPTREVASRLGISFPTLYKWIKMYSSPPPKNRSFRHIQPPSNDHEGGRHPG
jgi:transposase-like protein